MRPLFTIAIPTYNRSQFLKANLDQLKKELSFVDQDLVELIISDNCSTDDTAKIVGDFVRLGVPVNYVKNVKNYGWGYNFMQCYNLAQGKYVLILGDDDLIYDGGLAIILSHAAKDDYGVICLRPYGFNDDFRMEYPGTFGKVKEYNGADKFLSAISPIMRSISACIINKSLVRHIDFSTYPIGNFAHLHMIMHAILLAKKNLFINKYIIPCKRNNSFGYDFSEVFVKEYWALIDVYLAHGLSVKTINKLENQMLFTYYPYYILTERKQRTETLPNTKAIFDERFGDRFWYVWWVKLIIVLPRFPSICWGYMTTIIGRSLNGELMRGLAFIWKTKIK
jgi:abequosyltransferase